ncbi:DASH complex, subunit Spc19 [Wilcoxina mikolae CBS 423.85]|nr:DASH complex, subunit Spc19 [Wilcoxina mikolae CBS 423.85]
MSVSSVNNSLAGCVASLQGSSRLLDSSISILHSGVRDLPRTRQVMQISRHFELISEPALFAAQNALADEIGPEVEHLLRRVEEHLAKLERREKGLISRSELMEGRIHQNQPRRSVISAPEGGNEARAERLRLLRNKRERLEHTLERLSLQATHKERQLRMSLNYGAR